MQVLPVVVRAWGSIALAKSLEAEANDPAAVWRMGFRNKLCFHFSRSPHHKVTCCKRDLIKVWMLISSIVNIPSIARLTSR